MRFPANLQIINKLPESISKPIPALESKSPFNISSQIVLIRNKDAIRKPLFRCIYLGNICRDLVYDFLYDYLDIVGDTVLRHMCLQFIRFLALALVDVLRQNLMEIVWRLYGNRKVSAVSK